MVRKMETLLKESDNELWSFLNECVTPFKEFGLERFQMAAFRLSTMMS